MAAHDAFTAAMATAGLAMHKGTPEGDGSLHRYRVADDKPGSLNGWYVLHLDGLPFGAFGSWKTGQSLSWHQEADQPMSDAERRSLAARMAAAKAARDAEQAKVQVATRERASKLWNRAKPANNAHPYLVRKQVGAFGIRELGGRLVIPLRDTDGTLHSLQFINGEGDKRFISGGRKRGCYCAIGRPADVLCIAEGYATAATIYQATGHATAAAFDAGNLEPVAIALRHKFPRLTLLIAADNDEATEGNPGLTYATKAARAVGAAIALPEFGEVANV